MLSLENDTGALVAGGYLSLCQVTSQRHAVRPPNYGAIRCGPRHHYSGRRVVAESAAQEEAGVAARAVTIAPKARRSPQTHTTLT